MFYFFNTFVPHLQYFNFVQVSLVRVNTKNLHRIEREKEGIFDLYKILLRQQNLQNDTENS